MRSWHLIPRWLSSTQQGICTTLGSLAWPRVARAWSETRTGSHNYRVSIQTSGSPFEHNAITSYRISKQLPPTEWTIGLEVFRAAERAIRSRAWKNGRPLNQPSVHHVRQRSRLLACPAARGLPGEEPNYVSHLQGPTHTPSSTVQVRNHAQSSGMYTTRISPVCDDIAVNDASGKWTRGQNLQRPGESNAHHQPTSTEQGLKQHGCTDIDHPHPLRPLPPKLPQQG